MEKFLLFWIISLNEFVENLKNKTNKTKILLITVYCAAKMFFYLRCMKYITNSGMKFLATFVIGISVGVNLSNILGLEILNYTIGLLLFFAGLIIGEIPKWLKKN